MLNRFSRVTDEQQKTVSQMLIKNFEVLEELILDAFTKKLDKITRHAKNCAFVEYERMIVKNQNQKQMNRERNMKNRMTRYCVQFPQKMNEYITNLREIFPDFGKDLMVYPNPILVNPFQTEDQKYIKCEHCLREFPTVENLNRHFIHKHKYTHACKNCTCKFRNPLEAWIHSQIIHTPESKYNSHQCIFCNTLFQDGKGMRKHYMNRHFKSLREDYWASNKPGGQQQKTVSNVKINERRHQMELMRQRQLALRKNMPRQPQQTKPNQPKKAVPQREMSDSESSMSIHSESSL